VGNERSIHKRQINLASPISVGLLCLLSALVVNPWTAGWIRGPRALDYADVLRGYALCAAGLGAGLLVLGSLVGGGRHRRLDGVAVLVLVCSFIVLLDRALLAALGLPLWVYDTELSYRTGREADEPGRMGPPPTRCASTAAGTTTTISVAKPSGELRSAARNSITMGGVAEEPSNQLEAAAARASRGYQMINAG
jgi:hypothetical protein